MKYILLIVWLIHPFHVGVYEVFHNGETGKLEITMRIFIDDVELALQKEGHENFAFSSESDQKTAANRYLGEYLLKRFSIKIEDEEIKLNFLGYEPENDVVLCYIESEPVKEIGKIRIHNEILFDVEDEQINLIHFRYGDQMKSFKAVKGRPEGAFDTSTW